MFKELLIKKTFQLFSYKLSNRFYLRCDVVRSSAEGRCGDAALDSFLAHPEVGDLAVAVGVQQDVVQLQVSVKNKTNRHKFNSTNNISIFLLLSSFKFLLKTKSLEVFS